MNDQAVQDQPAVARPEWRLFVIALLELARQLREEERNDTAMQKEDEE